MREVRPEIRLSRAQVIRLSRLLEMKYRPSELAEIIGVHVDTVYRSYMPAGCPYERDSTGHIWIVGSAFRAWAKEILAIRKKRKTYHMGGDEAWCLKCNQPVKIIDPVSKRVNLYLELLQSKCTICGTTVNRAQRAKHD